MSLNIPDAPTPTNTGPYSEFYSIPIFRFVIDIVFADAVKIKEPVIVAKLLFWVNWELLNEFKEVNIDTICEEPDTTPFVAAIAPDIDVAYTFLQTDVVDPISYVFVVPALKFDVNTPNAEMLSDELFPKNKFPDIATSPVKYAFDAVILPIKLMLPTTGTFNGNNVITLLEPLPNWMEPLPLCKYNSPSFNVSFVVPLLIWNIAAIYYLFCLL